MPLMRSVLWYAARRLAADPRVRRKAVEIYQREVQPRVLHVARQAQAAARETPPLTDPRAFALKLKDRLRGR